MVATTIACPLLMDNVKCETNPSRSRQGMRTPITSPRVSRVLNATYCDVYVSKEKNQLEYAGLLTQGIRVEIYDESHVGNSLGKLATNYTTETVPALKLSNSRVAQFLQFVEAGAALPDVMQQLREFRIRGVLRQSEQGFASWTADALRVGKVPMDESIECIDQLFFVVHRRGFRKYAQAESHDHQFLSMKI